MNSSSTDQANDQTVQRVQPVDGCVSELTHLSLFSGIGGIDLAAEWAGFKTVAFVEKDPFCQKVLAKNFPGVEINDDVSVFDGTRFRGVDLLSGGFPCQDISIAHRGGGQGLEGQRSGLWFEMLRVIGEVKPSWVVCENVLNLMRMGIDTVLHGLESIGYSTLTLSVPASSVGAKHSRYRIFIVANLDSLGGERPKHSKQPRHKVRDNGGRQRSVGESGERKLLWVDPYPSLSRGSSWRRATMAHQPKLCRDLHGVPAELDRIRALGNCVVPQQVYPILNAIAQEVRSASQVRLFE